MHEETEPAVDVEVERLAEVEPSLLSEQAPVLQERKWRQRALVS